MHMGSLSPPLPLQLISCTELQLPKINCLTGCAPCLLPCNSPGFSSLAHTGGWAFLEPLRSACVSSIPPGRRGTGPGRDVLLTEVEQCASPRERLIGTRFERRDGPRPGQ